MTAASVTTRSAAISWGVAGMANAASDSAHEIATDLVVTEAAVKQHLLRLYQKFRVPEGPNRRTRLANEVVALGLVKPMPLPLAEAGSGEASGVSVPEQPVRRRREQAS